MVNLTEWAILNSEQTLNYCQSVMEKVEADPLFAYYPILSQIILFAGILWAARFVIDKLENRIGKDHYGFARTAVSTGFDILFLSVFIFVLLDRIGVIAWLL